MVDIQKEEINEAYKDVRSDTTSTSWYEFNNNYVNNKLLIAHS